MVPTTSSATHLVDEVLPQLAGRITGAAVRVPVASVSAVDLVVRTRDDVADDVFPQMLRERVGISSVLIVGAFVINILKRRNGKGEK